MRTPILLALSMLLLASCAGSRTTITKNYYVLGLDDVPTTTQPQANGQGFALNRVTLPDYLNERGIAMILTDSRVNIARNALWAEPLQNTIPRLLAHDIKRACACPVSIDQASADTDEATGNLSIRIDRFGPTEDGMVVLSGEIELSQAGSTGNSRTFYISKDLTGDGYAAAVRNMRELLSELADMVVVEGAPQSSS